MKLSKNNPIISITRWLLSQKGMMKIMPTFIRYGGWIVLAVYRLFGIRVLLLTTTGRKTGLPRTNPVLYIEKGEDYIITAHKGGSDKHPYWFLNLTANPRVEVEVFWRKSDRSASEIKNEAEQKELLSQFPIGFIEALQEHTDRSFPVIRLTPIASK